MWVITLFSLRIHWRALYIHWGKTGVLSLLHTFGGSSSKPDNFWSAGIIYRANLIIYRNKMRGILVESPRNIMLARSAGFTFEIEVQGFGYLPNFFLHAKSYVDSSIRALFPENRAHGQKKLNKVGKVHVEIQGKVLNGWGGGTFEVIYAGTESSQNGSCRGFFCGDCWNEINSMSISSWCSAHKTFLILQVELIQGTCGTCGRFSETMLVA